MNSQNYWKKLAPDSSLGFVGTFIAVISIFLFIPLFLHNHYANLFLQFSLAGLILSIIYTIKSNYWVAFSGIIMLIPYLLLDVIAITQDSIFYFVIAYGFLCIYLFFAIIVLLIMTFTMHAVDINLIFGTITIYLLVGVLWGKLYFIVHALLPHSFSGMESSQGFEQGLNIFYMDQFNLLYYSFSTLTTLGVGDITPIHRLAKSLTLIEAMFGQLFIAIVIAKVVSVWRTKEK